MRVWVPLTPETLTAAYAAGAVPPGGDRVTAPEDEESEYAALEDAAETSRALVAALGGRRRRVVLVAELADDADPDGSVPWRHVAAVHVDTTDDADPREDLAWFATQEVPHLLDDLAPPEGDRGSSTTVGTE